MRLFDAHCHLGWFDDPSCAARRAQTLDLGILAVTVHPEEYRALVGVVGDLDNVAVAAGLHPWWVHGTRDADALIDILPEVRFVGEIGLDAASRHSATWKEQSDVFERICVACSRTSDPSAPKVLSIHAVRSAGRVLDVLERTRAAERCRCVLHWFSGSSSELWRAVDLGCIFSFGERSLGTRRGREYVRILPPGHLLTETDLPKEQGSPMTIDDVASSLERTVAAVAAIRDTDAGDAFRLLANNAAALLGI